MKTIYSSRSGSLFLVPFFSPARVFRAYKWPARRLQHFSFCSLKTNFSLFSLKFVFLHCTNKAIRFLSWSTRASLLFVVVSCFSYKTIISYFRNLNPAIISFTCLWNSSGALHVPTEILVSHLCLPNGVWNVVSLLVSSSSFTCRKPSLASWTKYIWFAKFGCDIINS